MAEKVDRVPALIKLTFKKVVAKIDKITSPNKDLFT